jgi:FixJ family two-component response regulator
MMLKVAGYSVAAFSSADEFLVTCNPETRGCIILDINMPGMDGPQLQETLKQRGSGLQIIFLTGQGSIPQSVRAIKSGAIDFLTKPVDATALLTRVSEALEQCSRQFKSKSNSNTNKSRLSDLTEREKEVLQFVVAGYTSKEIADQLGLSIRTVENHRANIMYKTGASNVIELARLAMTFTSASPI